MMRRKWNEEDQRIKPGRTMSHIYLMCTEGLKLLRCRAEAQHLVILGSCEGAVQEPTFLSIVKHTTNNHVYHHPAGSLLLSTKIHTWSSLSDLDSALPSTTSMKKGQSYTNTEMAPTFELVPRFWIYQEGVSLLQEAWWGAEIVFEVDINIKSLSARFTHHPHATELSCTPAKAPTTLFDCHHVEMFATDHSGDKTTQYNAPQWHAWLKSCDKSHLPRIIVQLWQAQAAVEDLGPVSKLHRKPLERLGYTTRFQFLDGSKCGGAISQTRLAAISFLTPGYSEDKSLSLANPLDLDPRPMANCLRPFGEGPLSTINPTATELKVA
jgi:hypothetical protein